MSASEGLIGEDIVKRKLWQRGYRVKDVSQYSHFDLLLDNKFRVEVKTIFDWGKSKRKYIRLRKEEFDILAVVSVEPTSENIFFASQKDLEPLKAKSIAGLNSETSLDIAFNLRDLKKHFSKNLKKVVNKMGIH